MRNGGRKRYKTTELSDGYMLRKLGIIDLKFENKKNSSTIADCRTVLFIEDIDFL